MTMTTGERPRRQLVWPALLTALVAAGAAAAQPGAGTIDYRNAKFGFSLRVPADVFAEGVTRAPDAGNLWISRDAQARLVAGAQANESGASLQSYRKFLMDETYDQASFDYAPVRETWFVLSGTAKDGRLFYERVTFACDGRFIYGWQLAYPAAERQRYDRIVETIHRSYRVGQGTDGKCG